MKRKILVASCSVILLILGAGGCSSLRDRVDSMVVVTDWPSSSAWRVAVLDCETPGTKERIENGLTVTSIAGSGVKMADAVAELLGREDDYLVVDRALMLRTLQEHSLPTTGIPPSNKLAEMGRVLNADALVLGRCEGWHWGNQHEWGERFNASLWLIMTANGQAAWSAEGKAVLVGSRSDIIQLLAGDMVGKLVAGSGKAEPPPGLSSGPYPVAGESKITPVPPPPLAQASPPPPAPVAEKEMDDMPSLPDEFASIEAIEQAFADPKIKGRGEPTSTHINQSGYELFVIWVNPFSGRKADYSFAYFQNPRTGKWKILDRSFQEGEENLRNVYIDPGTSRLIYVGENGKIIREIALEE